MQHAATGCAASGADRVKADGQARQGTRREQGMGLLPACGIKRQTAFNPQALRVFNKARPSADGAGDVVLVEHGDAGGAARGERLRKGARLHDVALAVGHAEQRRVACEAPLPGRHRAQGNGRG